MIGKKRLAVAAAAVTVAGASLLPGAALADNSGAETQTGTAVSQLKRGGGERATRVAEALGITVEEFQTATQTVREALRPAERPTTPPTEEERAQRRADFQAALAAELGVSTETLEAAFESAKPTEEEIAARKAERLAKLGEKLEQAVADGRLTQEEADAILLGAENGERPERPFGGPGGHRGPRGGGPGGAPGGVPSGVPSGASVS